MGSPMWRTVCRFFFEASGKVQNGIVAVVAFGVRLGMGRTGEADRGVDAGTGVLGGIGVFVGSAMVSLMS